MKKNGFTLIELLLALALVIIIIGLVYQVFTRQLDNAKESTYERQINTIIQVAKDYHLQNLNSTFVTIETLNNEGLINKDDLIDPRNGSNIEGCVKFNMNQQYKQYEYLYFEDIINCQ